jgi:tetratricopeptide (TPR) repeat protein
MPGPSKPTDWMNKIPVTLTAVFGLIAAIAGFITAFREQWQLFIIIIAALILAYIFIGSLYIFLARRRTRARKNQWTYQYGRFRPLGLLGMLLVCLLLTAAMILRPVQDFVREGLAGTRTLTPTSTPFPTLTPIPTLTPSPTPTLVPSPTPPQLADPDVVIVRFDPTDPLFVLDVAGQLEGKLSEYFRENGLRDVHLQVRDDLTVESEPDAQNVANITKSRVVIWGKYDTTYIQVRLFLSGGDQAGTELPGTGQIGLTRPDPSAELAFKVQGVITENLSFLAPFVLGHLYYHSNNYEAGHEKFDFAMEHIPTNVEIESQSIIDFFEARKEDRQNRSRPLEDYIGTVICKYKDAILKDPAFDVAYNNLGLVVSRLYGIGAILPDEPDKDMPPQAVTCLQELQQQQLIGPDYEDPKMYFQRALEVNADLTLAKFNLYAFRFMQDPDPEALMHIVSEIEKIQQADASVIGTYILLASAKERQGDAAGAIQMYQLGVAQMDKPGISKTDPKMELMRFNLGQLFTQQEDWSTAENYFTQILDLRPDNYDAGLRLANLDDRQGKFAEAAPHLDAIFGISESGNPGQPAQQAIAWMLRSEGDFKQGNFSSAIASLEQATHTFLSDPFPHMLLGLLYQVEGQEDLARANFNKSLELDGADEQMAWSTFEERCLNNADARASFSDWALNRLPLSDCLGRDLRDPKERINTFYDLLSDALVQTRMSPSFSLTSAQCPFVYTQDPVTGEWEFQTTILYRLVNREAAQLRPLAQFNGRLLIREQEPEVSYLNRLYVLAKMTDGSTRILEPDVQALKFADDEYIVLNQGEEILVSLDDFPVSGQVREWWVMAAGYYTPY